MLAHAAALLLALIVAHPQTTRLEASGARGQEAPSQAPVDARRFEAIEPLVKEAIGEQKLPGAVILIGRGDRVLYHKAFGDRAVAPAREPMTLDTIFDVASLTKVVATTTSVMTLVEQGRLRLNDRVATFIPGFERYGKGDITVRHLLTHFSGLRPDVDLADMWTGYDTAIALALEEVPATRPGERFVYSDINFFLLGEIVHRVSGQMLDQYAQQHIFKPLGMRDTFFNPPPAVARRVAPTESCTRYGWPCQGPEMSMLRGVVHDPTARRMAGVAGHAGLFSTAEDLATFCRTLLAGGVHDGERILSPLAVEKMTSAASGPGEPNRRGLGWDIDSAFSSNRGELLPIGSFGHTGFTGTSIWLDPVTGLYVVFLSNRVHPDGKGDVTPLRARVATIAASAIGGGPRFDADLTWTGRDFGPTGPAPARSPIAVQTGIDAWRAEGFASLRGKRVGLITNQTGRARDGVSTIDLLFNAKEVTLAALFSPEHGIRGVLDEKVPAEVDPKTGLQIHSLYGETRRPTAAMLDGLDVLVVDLQDIGARFWTYPTTMAYALEEAAKRHLPIFVIDRPNPINGFQIEGPLIDKSQLGFTAYLPMPVRHGLTFGELAKLYNGENGIGAALTVVEMKGWRRDAWFDETGLTWINPSPNMRNLVQATLYPGIGSIEGTNISVGRGTDTPFEQLGAPWMDGPAIAAALNARGLPGIRFYPTRFTPTSSKHAGAECSGIFMIVTDRTTLRPVRLGVEIAAALVKHHGRTFEIELAERLLGSKDTIARLRAGEDPATIASSWEAGEARWRLTTRKYLLYR